MEAVAPEAKLKAGVMEETNSKRQKEVMREGQEPPLAGVSDGQAS